MMASATHSDDVEPSTSEPVHNQADSQARGPDGGTWDHADWTARVRPTTNGAITAYPMRGVWLVEMAAPLTEVAEDLAHTIEWALAECPRGVVVDLKVAPDDTSPTS